MRINPFSIGSAPKHLRERGRRHFNDARDRIDDWGVRERGQRGLVIAQDWSVFASRVLVVGMASATALSVGFFAGIGVTAIPLVDKWTVLGAIIFYGGCGAALISPFIAIPRSLSALLDKRRRWLRANDAYQAEKLRLEGILTTLRATLPEPTAVPSVTPVEAAPDEGAFRQVVKILLRPFVLLDDLWRSSPESAAPPSPAATPVKLTPEQEDNQRRIVRLESQFNALVQPPELGLALTETQMVRLSKVCWLMYAVIGFIALCWVSDVVTALGISVVIGMFYVLGHWLSFEFVMPFISVLALGTGYMVGSFLLRNDYSTVLISEGKATHVNLIMVTANGYLAAECNNGVPRLSLFAQDQITKIEMNTAKSIRGYAKEWTDWGGWLALAKTKFTRPRADTGSCVSQTVAQTPKQ